MRFSVAIWKIEARLLGLLLLEILTLTVFLSMMAAWTFGCIATLWIITVPTLFKIVEVGMAAALLYSIYHVVWSVLEDPCDEPLREPLANYPDLKETIDGVAREVKCPAPQSAAFFLSPIPWRQFGCNPARLIHRAEIPIPVACLDVWSMLSLRCHAAHFLVRRRPRRWLFYLLRRSLTRLLRERNPRIRHDWSRLHPQRLAPAYMRLLTQWNVLADMEADRRIAQVMDGSAVATWIFQTQLACQVAPGCLQRVIEPATEHGVLLPVAAACALYVTPIEPAWLAIVDAERIRAQQSKPGNPLLRTVLMRLMALPGGPALVQDPRPASRLLPDLAGLEEKLLRREASLSGRELRRAAIRELGEAVLLPMMREEVDRNRAVLEGRSVADVPDMLRETAALAPRYHSDPRYLLDPRQRQAFVPWLVTSFLAVELERAGWRVEDDLTPVLTMHRNGRSVCPQQVIHALRKKEMTSEGFRELLGLPG